MKIRLFFILFFYIIALSAQDKLVLFFDFNQDIINEKSQQDFCKWLEHSKGKEILKIQGYCDSIDSNSYNKELSFRRANNVLALLEFNKVPLSKKLELYGLGEDFEQLKNQSDNRKVLVYYQDKISINKKTDNENLVFEKDQVKEVPVNETKNNISLIEKVNNAKIGDLIKLENLNFYFNSERIITESEPILSDLLQVLKMNPQLKIYIYGHICCNENPNDVKLSYRRSKFVFDYLIRNGIATSRLGHRGFGSSRPIYALPEKNEAERIANRRVEILVVKK
ncbi:MULTISPECIES: OmpA family protein [Flavobacterium]|uniref:OmpA family protein n=1 Tax=Flavobacterium algoritolerans TaxID=3041254 RepID=A0ABT6V4Y5_9FLAO|nr:MULTISPECIES: OmpA family protein [Flavobacterium]MDI5886252.1 OmpA family protein [Flavobacterium yafengii]MDI5893301.1 OmpA family protein [Flavobacterium algoritolerans]